MELINSNQAVIKRFNIQLIESKTQGGMSTDQNVV